MHSVLAELLAKRPALHCSHCVRPVDDVAKPGAQSTHDVLLGRGCTVPRPHSKHADKPLLLPNVPASQNRQTVWPKLGMRDPMSHGKQLCWPAAGCTVPGLHGVQSDWPGWSVKRPAGHAEH